MKKEAYRLANEIGAKWELDTAYQKERLEAQEIEKYKTMVRDNIMRNTKDDKKENRKENKKTNKKAKRIQKKSSRLVAAAACAAAIICSAAVFGEEVHAAIEQIRWNIGSALGLSGDLAAYSSVVHTSVMDNGYVITLQEVVAAEGKLVANYTLQREDGEPMEKIYVPVGNLSINGKTVYGGSSGGGQFLNEEHTITGIDMTYDVAGVDLAQENSYQLKFDAIDAVDGIKGKWDFQFMADGADLIADTIHLPMQQEFSISEDIHVVLEELTINELEQMISYRIEGSSQYMLMIKAEDNTGRHVKFGTRRFEGASGNGYMINEQYIDDGRISEAAESVTFTVYAVKIPEESGKMNNDYVQIGEPFTMDIN